MIWIERRSWGNSIECDTKEESTLLLTAPEGTKFIVIPELSPNPAFSADQTNFYGGLYGMPQACPHTELTEEEFVALCVELFGGSFQDLFGRLRARGYSLVKGS